MSTTAPYSDRTTTAALLALWRRPVCTLQYLLTQTLAPLPDLQLALAKLRSFGCLIEYSPGGDGKIELVSTALPCWSDVLEHQAQSQKLTLGRRVMVFSKTGSTNDIAWQCAVGGADTDGLVVVADEQTAGRGRLGHTWSAKPAQSLLLSILLTGPLDTSIDKLTLLAGLAGARAIESAFAVLHPAAPVPQIQIKWPNDLLVEGRKLAGILVERRQGQVVIGIGVNVTQALSDFPIELHARAASLYTATGLLVDRLRIAAHLLQELHALLRTPAADEGWLSGWKARCPMIGTRISALAQGRNITGQVLDISLTPPESAGLVLRDDLGHTHFLSAQTTTLQVPTA